MTALFAFQAGFIITGVLIALGFIFVFGTIIFTFVHIAKNNKINDAMPKVTVNARVVSKRAHVFGRRHASTCYYVTFELDGGDRTELSVFGSVYGMIAEGDEGALTFQGTDFLEFERNI